MAFALLKSLLSTGTSIDLTALRYSTKNFYTFSEYNTMGYARRDEDIFYTPDRRRSSFQTQVSQQLGSWDPSAFVRIAMNTGAPLRR